MIERQFHLEGAIAQWRDRLSGREAFTEADLDEMEGHLRQEVDALIAAGRSEKDAFFQAAHGFGENLKLAWRFNCANWETVMMKRTRYAPSLVGNYFKVAMRNLFRHKLYSFINIAGLAVGIACSVLIFLFVRDELTYDRHHEKADRIYRVNLEWHYDNGDHKKYAATAIKSAPALLEETPEIEYATRFVKAEVFVERGDYRFYEDEGFFADASAFEVFSFPFLKGDSKTALVEPYNIVITEKMAQKYFQSENPIGQSLTVQDTIIAKVTGVLAALPSNSHLKFDFLISFETLESAGHPIVTKWAKYWGNMNPRTYILLRESANPDVVAKKILRLVGKRSPEEEKQFKVTLNHTMIPLIDIHLRSDYLAELEPGSSEETVYLFLGIAGLILLMACINFMNLSTARSISRAQEVGMRKVVGARRRQLVFQFLGEAFLMTLIAVGLSVSLIQLALGSFNDLAGKTLTPSFFQDDFVGLSLLVVTLFVGLVAGSYPAFVLSRFKPVEVLKGVLKGAGKGVWVRQGLVVFQFTISVVLIISTTVVFRQLEYMSNQNLGFDKDHIVVIPFHFNSDLQNRSETIKAAFMAHSQVKSASASGTVPGRYFGDMKFLFKNEDGEAMKSVLYQHVDADFLTTFGLEVVAGRDFSREFPSDLEKGFMLNEAAVAYLGLGTVDEALKADHVIWGRQIIGVVADFHHNGLQQAIEPLFLLMNPTRLQYLSVKIQSDNVGVTLTDLEKTWQTLVPNRPFEYFFLDAEFDKQYHAEERLGKIFTTFSSLAIFIGCLGLLGLVSFAAQQRTREIGIRKILGASISGIVALLSTDFMKLVLVANVIAWPVAYYAMGQWLENFAYRIELSATTFILSGLVALMIALITVSYQAFKAARANPVDALRYE